jgi:hypothetical protein
MVLIFPASESQPQNETFTEHVGVFFLLSWNLPVCSLLNFADFPDVF